MTNTPSGGNGAGKAIELCWLWWWRKTNENDGGGVEEK